MQVGMMKNDPKWMLFIVTELKPRKTWFVYKSLYLPCGCLWKNSFLLHMNSDFVHIPHLQIKEKDWIFIDVTTNMFLPSSSQIPQFLSLALSSLDPQWGYPSIPKSTILFYCCTFPISLLEAVQVTIKFANISIVQMVSGVNIRAFTYKFDYVD